LESRELHVFEIIKLIISLFGKLLDPSELGALIKRRHSEDLGARLFMLYTVLDDIAIDGEAIVERLEAYVEEMTQRSATENDRWSLCGLKGFSNIAPIVRKQAGNLERLVRTSRLLGTELHLINPNAYRVFELLSSDTKLGKRDLVAGLDRTLKLYELNRLPLRVPASNDLVRVSEQLSETLIADATANSNDFRDYRLPEQLLARIEQLKSEFDAGGVAIDTALWDAAIFEQIRLYLEHGKPRDQLIEIRTAAQELRQSLEALFPLSDILWKVGSSRFRKQYDVL